MQAITFHTHSDSVGLLRLEVPVGLPDEEFEVVVILQPVKKAEAVDALGWPLGFFDETYGSLADDPIERPDQGQLEVRDETL